MDGPKGGEKKVDESWKEQVERERRLGGAPPSGPSWAREKDPDASPAPPVVDFQFFLSSLSMQVMIALGEMAATGEPTRVDLDQARYLIDVLGMLREKTQGNLTSEETTLLDGLLYEFRVKYVAKQGGTRSA